MPNTERIALLTDNDGTLIDSDRVIQGSFQYAIKTLGYEERSTKEIGEVIGLTLEECYERLVPGGDIEALCGEHRIFQKENAHLAVAFPNTVNTLIELRKRGIEIAVVTSRMKASFIEMARSNEILDLINVIVAKDDTANQKPDPEPLVLALRKLGMKPANAVMLGDTSMDVEAGKAAGVETIGATYGSHGERVRESNPTYVVNDISEIYPIIMTQLLVRSGKLS